MESLLPQGNSFSQEEAPGSLFKSTTLWDGNGRSDLIVEPVPSRQSKDLVNLSLDTTNIR